MGGYFSKKDQKEQNFASSQDYQSGFKVPAEPKTLYRPDVFVDFYQSNLFKVK